MKKLCAVALLALSGLGAEAPPQPDPVADHDPLAAVLQEAPRTTRTKEGVPGDPLNVALVATRREVVAAFCAAGWCPADPITLRSSVGISVSVLFNVPYPRAPVSTLYLFGRPQNLAFEQEAGPSARKRHHVRFWCSGATTPDGRAVWLGSATFDQRVGRGPSTGRITHRIAPDIDRERDKLMGDLVRSGRLDRPPVLVPWTGPTVGRNGAGDCYFTDGNLAVGVLRNGCRPPLPLVPPADDSGPQP